MLIPRPHDKISESDNAAHASTGHYMTVWVKENGVWKVRADLGNTDPKKP